MANSTRKPLIENTLKHSRLFHPQGQGAESGDTARRPANPQKTSWIFKWPDYTPPTQASPAQIAAAELAAKVAFYQHRPPTPPDRFELRYCLPAPRTAAYEDLRTGELVLLRRDTGLSTFCKIGDQGWEPWVSSDE